IWCPRAPWDCCSALPSCRGDEVNRRFLLKHGALVAAGSFLPVWTRRALAQETGGSKVLVFLFLRGALDGLHAVPPVDEPRLYALRPPRSLQGARGALAFSALDQLRLHALAGAPAGKKGRIEAQAAFDAMYGLHSDEPVAASGKEAFAALQLLEGKLEGGLEGPAPDYPKAPLSQPLRQLARLIKADVGLRIGCLDAGGWDTHAAQPARLESGLRRLAESLAAFQRDRGRRASDVMLIAATEFGRTVRQNGANGTDHGHASIAFVLGG